MDLNEYLDKHNVIMIPDPEHSRVWIWLSKNNSTRIKFIAMNLAPNFLAKNGINYKIIPVEQDEEPLEFKDFIQSSKQDTDQNIIKDELNRKFKKLIMKQKSSLSEQEKANLRKYLERGTYTSLEIYISTKNAEIDLNNLEETLVNAIKSGDTNKLERLRKLWISTKQHESALIHLLKTGDYSFNNYPQYKDFYFEDKFEEKLEELKKQAIKEADRNDGKRKRVG